MKVRRFEPSTDHPTISGWWERRGLKAPPIVLLPETGVMVESGGTPIACAFLYEDVWGKVAMVEWECTNPDTPGPISTLKALNRLFDFFETYCKDKGIMVVLSWTAEERGDGRLLRSRKWVNWPGPRHELMCFETKGAA